MEPAERARIYAAFADSSRRLASLMDTKAGFLFAANGGLLTFMWIGARVGDVVPAAQWLAIGASLSSLLALLAALWIIVPRRTNEPPAGARNEYRPVSYYGYVATRYGNTEFPRFDWELADLDDAVFAREGLEGDFVVSRFVQAKSKWVWISGGLTLAGIALAGAALLSRKALRVA